jgi:citrate lyase subunit alpha/citrate CoA-transferase
MSASMYANPHNRGAVVNQLDVMILGATEVDLDFNVNVTTASNGKIIGGSGGHSDTAAGAKLALVTTKLTAGAYPKIVERVTTVTTPGETIDAIVTEQGIAVNPRRKDLADRLTANGIATVSIEELQHRATKLAPARRSQALEGRPVAVLEYRDGSVIDIVREVNASL